MTGLLAALGPDAAIASAALHLAILVVIARLGAHLAGLLGQPAVLGELLVGIVAGGLALAGVPVLAAIAADPLIELLAGLGVIILLFEVGIESTVREMVKIGAAAVTVAMVGVATPFALGYLVGWWLIPDRGPLVHAFLGAALTATSIGITARVLQDLRLTGIREARIILGAAVLDDVFGLVILAVVSGAITASAAGGAGPTAADVAWIVGKAAGFLIVSLLLGLFLSRWLFRLARALRPRGSLLIVCLAFGLFMAWVAQSIGLAAIVGAFAAGLILEETGSEVEAGQPITLEEQVRPITTVLAPLFFVLMGMRVDLRSLLEPGALVLALVLTLAAVAGKVASGLGIWDRGLNKLAVGIGMVPRGEVGLVFAGIGLGLSLGDRPVLDAGLFAAIVFMVVVTTLATPPALAWALARRRPRETGQRASTVDQAEEGQET